MLYRYRVLAFELESIILPIFCLHGSLLSLGLQLNERVVRLGKPSPSSSATDTDPETLKFTSSPHIAPTNVTPQPSTRSAVSNLNMAPITILSYNVRGLTTRKKHLRTRLFLEHLHQSSDILCIQEHKLRASGYSHLEYKIWNTAAWTFAPAADGLHAQRNQNVNNGLGGLAVAIGKHLSPYISAKGIMPGGRAI